MPDARRKGYFYHLLSLWYDSAGNRTRASRFLGGCLTITPRNRYINDLSSHIPIAVSKSLFADDLVIWTSDKYPILTKAKLNRAVRTISVYCQLWKLHLNTQKTVYTIFSRSHKAAKRTINLEIDGCKLVKEDCPTYL